MKEEWSCKPRLAAPSFEDDDEIHGKDAPSFTRETLQPVKTLSGGIGKCKSMDVRIAYCITIQRTVHHRRLRQAKC